MPTLKFFSAQFQKKILIKPNFEIFSIYCSFVGNSGHCSLIFRFSDPADPIFCQNGNKIKLKIEKKNYFETAHSHISSEI